MQTDDIIDGLSVNLKDEALFDKIIILNLIQIIIRLNFPNISSTSIDFNNLVGKKDMELLWSYIVDNKRGYLDEIPDVSDYDISFNIYRNNTLYLEFEPDTPLITIDSSKGYNFKR